MATPCGELKVDSENIPSFLPGLGPKRQDKIFPFSKTSKRKSVLKPGF